MLLYRGVYGGEWMAMSSMEHIRPVWSERVQEGNKVRSLLCGLLAVALVMAVIMWALGPHRHDKMTRSGSLVLYAFGLPLFLLGHSLFGAHMRLYNARRLLYRMRAKCEALYGVDLAGALYVGIVPGVETKVYRGDTVLDLGFLRFEPGRMVFYGDRYAFELSPSEVERVDLASYSDMALVRFPRVDIVWRSGPDQEAAVIGIEPRDSAFLPALWSGARELLASTLDWCNGSGGPAIDRIGMPPAAGEMPGTASGFARLSLGSELLVFAVGALVIGICGLLQMALRIRGNLAAAIFLGQVFYWGFADALRSRLLKRQDARTVGPDAGEH